MTGVAKLRAESRFFGGGSTLHGAESADASRAGMHFRRWVVIVVGGRIMGSRVREVGWTTKTCIDVIIKGATFSPLHQDTVKQLVNQGHGGECVKRVYCKVGILGPKVENWADSSHAWWYVIMLGCRKVSSKCTSRKIFKR